MRAVASASLHAVRYLVTLEGMLSRPLAFALVLPLLFGCSPVREAQMDEQRNPYFIEGKDRIGSRDYKGAIAAFEKALEINPRSALAHFELAVLYEQHSEQRENDYVAALYHYNQVVRLRPHAYPSDNARQRIASCKQELVRSQSMAPVYQQTVREIDRLKEENQQLRRQVETLTAQAASQFIAPAALASRQTQTTQPSGPGARSESSIELATRSGRPGEGTWETPIVVVTNSVASVAKERGPRGAQSAPATGRSHTVKAGETPYSIARSYGIRADALLAANPGLDARRVRIGQTIAIPRP
jgi:LysM repeat protein